jgi:hypothetical protein
MSAPASSLTVSLSLSKDLEVKLTYDNRAEYRMSTLDRPFTIGDLRNKKRSWGSLVAWTWACMSKTDALKFSGPEDLVDIFADEAVVDAAFVKIIETWSAANPKNSKG